jgi:hypothetical protein
MLIACVSLLCVCQMAEVKKVDPPAPKKSIPCIIKYKHEPKWLDEKTKEQFDDCLERLHLPGRDTPIGDLALKFRIVWSYSDCPPDQWVSAAWIANTYVDDIVRLSKLQSDAIRLDGELDMTPIVSILALKRKILRDLDSMLTDLVAAGFLDYKAGDSP